MGVYRPLCETGPILFLPVDGVGCLFSIVQIWVLRVKKVIMYIYTELTLNIIYLTIYL